MKHPPPAAIINPMPTQITLNGDPHTLTDAPATIESLIQSIGLAGQAVAVEVNKAVVPKKQHATHNLADGDTVEVVTLVGGG